MSSLDCRGVKLDEFWLHSLRTGIIARLIARHCRGFNPEVLFLAGILHDLGILVIYQQNATLAAAVSRHIEDTHQLRDQAEREVLGFDHAEIGALLIDAWGLSPDLVELISCHHQYQLAQNNKKAATMLGLANLLADLDFADSDPRTQSLLEELEIGAEDIAEILQTAENQCDEVKNIILG